MQLQRKLGDEEDLAAPLKLLDHGAQSCLVVGERFVVKPFPGAVEGDRVMFAFPTSTPTNTSTLS